MMWVVFYKLTNRKMHVITFRNTKSVKTKPLRWGNIRVLFTVNKHLFLYLYLYTYLRLYTITLYDSVQKVRHFGGPL